jgi:hypothetical protein
MPSWASPDELTWLAATSVAVGLLAAILGEWARQRPEVRGRVIAGSACALLGGALVLALVAPTDIPTGWITVLQEGRSIRNVQQLYGYGTHAGPGFYALVDWLSGHGPSTLPIVVRANLCLGVVNAIVFFFLASHVLRSWWASVAFAAAYACNPNTVQAAFSETPAMAWTIQVWLACIAAAVVSDHGASRWLRHLALAWLGLLAVLAASLRSEALVLGVPALAIGIAHVVGAEEWMQRAVRSAGRHLRTIVTGPLAVFLLFSAGLLGLEFVPVPENWRYAIAGLRPLNFSFLTWLQTITLLFPFAIVVLFVLGVMHGVRRWYAFFFLPISVLTLFKIYASGSHGAFLDKFRYLTFVTPLVLVLALFGFRELSYWAERLSWPAWWKRVAVLLLVATVPAWNPWPREFFGRRQQLPGVPTAEAFLARNQQTEVRYLVDLLDRYPRCVFVVRTPRAESASDTRTGYRWSAFGKSLRHLRQKEDAGATVEQIAAELTPESSCVLFYRSMDCDLVGLDDCTAETDGRIPLEERALENLPYSEIYEYGAHRPEMRLGVYPVVVRDRGSVGSAAAAPH